MLAVLVPRACFVMRFYRTKTLLTDLYRGVKKL